MQLHFLTEANLQDRLFVQQYVHGFKEDSKALIVVDSFGGTLRDTRFVARRLSTLLSETLVYNNAFSGEQRNLVSRDKDGSLHVKTTFLRDLIEPLNAVVLGSIAAGTEGPELLEGAELVEAIRAQLKPAEVLMFPTNPMSPLSSKSRTITGDADITDLLAAYEEEADILKLAARLAPVRLTGPNGM